MLAESTLLTFCSTGPRLPKQGCRQVVRFSPACISHRRVTDRCGFFSYNCGGEGHMSTFCIPATSSCVPTSP